MFKVTSLKSGMRIVTVKAFGFYVNFSFGRSAKPAAAKARRMPLMQRLYNAATPEQRDLAERKAYREMVGWGWEDRIGTKAYERLVHKRIAREFRLMGIDA